MPKAIESKRSEPKYLAETNTDELRDRLTADRASLLQLLAVVKTDSEATSICECLPSLSRLIMLL